MITGNPRGYSHFQQHLIRVDQGLLRAVRVLLFGYHRHQIRSIGISVGDMIVGLTILLRQKLYPAARPAVLLPVEGDLAIRVHRGHKVFDFEASRVTKVFAKDVQGEEAATQVAASRTASAVPAAPRFIGADENLLWYSEEYVRGKHGTDTERARQGRFMDFYPAVETCLLDLIECSDDRRVDLVSYLEELTAPSLLHSWDASSKADGAAQEIRSYQVSLKRWLSDNIVSSEIDLVLVHGDFALVNVIVDEEFRVIDWEGIRYGSLCGDVFNFVFTEKYYERAHSDVTAEIDAVFEHFAAAVAKRFPKLASAANMPKAFALRLYYLERLKIMLERDVSTNLTSVIRKSIHMFRRFDAAAGLPELEGR